MGAGEPRVGRTPHCPSLPVGPPGVATEQRTSTALPESRAPAKVWQGGPPGGHREAVGLLQLQEAAAPWPVVPPPSPRPAQLLLPDRRGRFSGSDHRPPSQAAGVTSSARLTPSPCQALTSHGAVRPQAPRSGRGQTLPPHHPFTSREERGRPGLCQGSGSHGLTDQSSRESAAVTAVTRSRGSGPPFQSSKNSSFLTDPECPSLFLAGDLPLGSFPTAKSRVYGGPRPPSPPPSSCW